MIGFNNHPNVQQATIDKIHWFYSLSPADRRGLLRALIRRGRPAVAGLAEPRQGLLQQQGRRRQGDQVCNSYRAGDMSVWNWA